MTMTDTLVRTALDRAKPLLDRFGIIASPIRALLDARRALTIGRPVDAVRGVLGDPATARALFGRPAELDQHSSGDGPFVWWLEGGQASAALSPGPEGTTEVLMEVRLDKLTEGTRPRYADNAGVIAVRALHRAKSLIETGEIPTLAGNPAARAEPDPYGD